MAAPGGQYPIPGLDGTTPTLATVMPGQTNGVTGPAQMMPSNGDTSGNTLEQPQMSNEQIMSFLSAQGLSVGDGTIPKKRKVETVDGVQAQMPMGMSQQPQSRHVSGASVASVGQPLGPVGVGVGIGNGAGQGPGPSAQASQRLGATGAYAPDTAAALQHLAADGMSYGTYDWTQQQGMAPQPSAPVSAAPSAPNSAGSQSQQLPLAPGQMSGHQTPTHHAQAMHNAMQAQNPSLLNEAVMAAVRNSRPESASPTQQTGAGTGNNGQVQGGLVPPEIRFDDEHATANGSYGDDNAQSAQQQGPNGDSPDNAGQNEQDNHNGNLLAPPGDKKHQPFSRSPELKVSHKLAERKRRKEMRDLFDELKDQLPPERGAKTSKWEVLTRAIDYLTIQNQRVRELERELERTRRELDTVRSQAIVYGTQASAVAAQSQPHSAPVQSQNTVPQQGQYAPYPASAPATSTLDSSAQMVGVGVGPAAVSSQNMSHTHTAPPSLPPTAAASRAGTPAPITIHAAPPGAHISGMQTPTSSAGSHGQVMHTPGGVQMTPMTAMSQGQGPMQGQLQQPQSAPATPMPMQQGMGVGVGVGYVNGNGQ